MRIEVRILDPRLPGWGFPAWGSDAAAGLDLHACLAEPVAIPPGETARLVPAGFALAIADPAWCALLAPRSGLGHRGLVLGNAVGVIDADYTGEILVSAWNRNPPGTEPISIRPGDRIAQMLFVRVERPRFETVTAFSGSIGGRGAGGFGSTGLGTAGRDAARGAAGDAPP